LSAGTFRAVTCTHAGRDARPASGLQQHASAAVSISKAHSKKQLGACKPCHVNNAYSSDCLAQASRAFTLASSACANKRASFAVGDVGTSPGSISNAVIPKLWARRPTISAFIDRRFFRAAMPIASRIPGGNLTMNFSRTWALFTMPAPYGVSPAYSPRVLRPVVPYIWLAAITMAMTRRV
jgi:hypothetical protein